MNGSLFYPLLHPPRIPSVSHLSRVALKKQEKGTEGLVPGFLLGGRALAETGCLPFGAALFPDSEPGQLEVAPPVGVQPLPWGSSPTVILAAQVFALDGLVPMGYFHP